MEWNGFPFELLTLLFGSWIILEIQLVQIVRLRSENNLNPVKVHDAGPFTL